MKQYNMDKLSESSSAAAVHVSFSEVLYFILHRHRSAFNSLPPTIVIIGTAVFILLVVISYKKHVKNRAFAAFSAAHEHHDPPLIPNNFPWGFLHKFKVLKFKGDFLDDFVAAKYKRFGNTHAIKSTLTGQIKAINTNDPENIKAILSTYFTDYNRPNIFKMAATEWIGEGIFMSDGPAWSRGRALLRPHFHNRKFNDLSILKTHFSDFQKALGTTNEQDWTGEVNLVTLFQRFAMDTSTEFLFGTSTESQRDASLREEHGEVIKRRRSIFDPTNPPAPPVSASGIINGETFSEAFDNASQFVTIRLRLGNLAWLYTTKSFRRNCQIVHEYADKLISEAAQKTPAEKRGKHDKLLDSILESTSDHIDVRSQLLNALIAGRDTSAALLSWLFAQLLVPSNAPILARLRRELDKHFGNGEELTFESLKACHYLQWVFMEGNRLYPAASINARLANTSTVLPVGGGADGMQPIAIQKGTRVNFCPYLIHRRTDIWGEDAWDFKPERWENRKVGWEYIPFSGGPRTCIGQSYSQATVGYMLVRILQTFDNIETLMPEEKQLTKSPHVNGVPRFGVKVRMHKTNIFNI